MCCYVHSGNQHLYYKLIDLFTTKIFEQQFPSICNDIVGVIYRHPNMSTTEFTDHKLNDLMLKLSLERNKKIYIADFNFDLLKTSTHSEISSNLLIPLITLPTKINKKNNRLIDNIFTNQFNPDTISGNLTVNMSDHLPSFIMSPRSNQNHLPKKHNIYKRDLKNFDRENFILDILGTNWNNTIIQDNADLSFN